jgi:hypothetical protein
VTVQCPVSTYTQVVKLLFWDYSAEHCQGLSPDFKAGQQSTLRQRQRCITAWSVVTVKVAIVNPPVEPGLPG